MNGIAKRREGWNGIATAALAAVLSTLWFSVTGCAEDPPKPTPSREVKTDSDRFFEKMKQEERERGKGPDGTTR